VFGRWWLQVLLGDSQVHSEVGQVGAVHYLTCYGSGSDRVRTGSLGSARTRNRTLGPVHQVHVRTEVQN
jgi:hypothetical protein